jgi:hypothetical protein
VVHDAGEDAPAVARGRSALSIRPDPSSLVAADSLHGELERRDPGTEPQRCRLLHALLDHGPIQHRPFDPSLPVFKTNPARAWRRALNFAAAVTA